jgi:hypothetical protein
MAVAAAVAAPGQGALASGGVERASRMRAGETIVWGWTDGGRPIRWCDPPVSEPPGEGRTSSRRRPWPPAATPRSANPFMDALGPCLRGPNPGTRPCARIEHGSAKPGSVESNLPEAVPLPPAPNQSRQPAPPSRRAELRGFRCRVAALGRPADPRLRWPHATQIRVQSLGARSPILRV